MFGLFKKTKVNVESSTTEIDLAELNTRLETLEVSNRISFGDEIVVYTGFGISTTNNQPVLYFKRPCSISSNHVSCYPVTPEQTHESLVQRALQDRQRFIQLKNQLKVFGYQITDNQDDSK